MPYFSRFQELHSFSGLGFHSPLIGLVGVFLLLTCAASGGKKPAPAVGVKPCRMVGEPPPLPDIGVQEIASGLRNPVHIAHAGDGSRRLFIVEQAGIIRIYKDGKLLPEPFLNIKERVRSGGEMGLLGVAFHPNFSENRRFFVDYTSGAGGLHTVISEFLADRENENYAAPDREKILLTIPQPFPNHNGGQVAFGPDGYLYIGMGDGGSANDPLENGQNLASLLGKILRIDVNRSPEGKPYAIPPDNPFVNQPGSRPEIYAYGLRNPWRFSFDALTGNLFAADVGQNQREEIDLIQKGKNYGWNIMEGKICTPGVNPNCNPAGLEPPILDYGHELGISIIGGFVYRGSQIPSLCGAYIYGDYGSGRIWALRYDANRQKITQNRQLLKTSLSISSFGEDEQFEIYVADHIGGKIFRLIPTVLSQ